MSNENEQNKALENQTTNGVITKSVKITDYVNCNSKSVSDRLTYDEVEKAIEHLASTGTGINCNTVRGYLNRGSFSTVLKHINTYMTKEQATTAELEFSQNGIQECQDLAIKLVKQAFLGNIKSCKEKIALSQKEHEQYKKLMTTQVEAVDDLNSKLEKERDELKAQVASLTEKLNNSEKKTLETLSQTNNLKNMLDAVKTQNEELMQKVMQLLEAK